MTSPATAAPVPDYRPALADADLFAGAPAPLLASTVAGSETRDLQAGDRLLAAGDDNDVLYIVLSGTLSVHVPGTTRPHVQLGVGECVGELSLIDGLHVSADVVADEPTVVLALDREQLWTLMDACPVVARNLLRVLAGRVRHDDRALGESDRLQRQYEEAATVDPLTGLRNRRWLDEAFERQAERTRRVGRSLSLLMIDVDHFKPINDQCGHLVGDAVLRHLAQVLAGSLRPQDLLARFGGEEFAVLLPGVERPQALSVAERLRHAVEQAPAAPGGGNRPRVTVSVGVATRGADEPETSTATLLERADRALYRAKQDGRNCVRT
ncbi:MAG: GGDEF domain-containing protein [Vicinamibacterales bacterium]